MSALAGALLKLDRAKHHRQAFLGAHTAFFDRKPYEMWTEDDPETGDRAVYAKLTQTVDPALSLTLGDAIHNLRSAFEHVAWEMATRVGTASKSTTFPVTTRQADFDDRIGKSLASVPIDQCAAVERLQPYNTLDGYESDPLYLINRLDIEDKHRAIIITAMAIRNREVSLTYPDGTCTWDTPGEFDPFPMLSLNQPTFIYGMARGVLTGPPRPVKVKSRVHFQIAFGEEGPLYGEPVHEVLSRLINFTESALKSLARVIQ